VKILVADDEPFFRRLARAALETLDHDLVEVSDGTEAWSRLEGADPPQLAILDWIMPGISGVEVCEKVRQRLVPASPYLILVTARDGPEDIVVGLDAGADDYLTKPYNPAELRARVQVGVRILSLRQHLAERVRALEEALAQVRRLQGLLPMCAWCRKIRNDQNYWQSVEQYVAEQADVRFTHGICPECRTKAMGS